jgi:hypothetical protein
VNVGEVRVTLLDLLNDVTESLVDLLKRLHLLALEGREGRETEADTLSANGGDESVDDFKEEAGAVLDGSAVLVGAAVRDGLLQ